MKITKKKIVIFSASVAVILLTVCGMYAIDRYCMKKNKPVVFSTWGYSYVPPVTPVKEQWDLIPMVRIDGTLYMDTGQKSTHKERLDAADGEILYSVPRSEVPMEDNTSNFGTGFYYQYAEEGTVELFMHGTWWIFATEEKKNKMLFPEGEQSFVGTVMEETDTYMLICPNEDEKERICGDRIHVNYIEPQDDVRYGIGRRVVIFYDGAEFGTEITAKDILPDGYRNFTIRVTPNLSAKKKLLLAAETEEDGNIYCMGVSEAFVGIGEESFLLEAALQSGKITRNGILAQVQADAEAGLCEAVSYRDGGSIVYRYPGYTLIRYHTKDGNRDIYIGSTSIDIRAKDE